MRIYVNRCDTVMPKPRKGYATRKNLRKKRNITKKNNKLLNWQRAGDVILTLNKTNLRACACATTRARPLSGPHYSYFIFLRYMDNK